MKFRNNNIFKSPEALTTADVSQLV